MYYYGITKKVIDFTNTYFHFLKKYKNMKICFISDTHGLHNKLYDLPIADIIVHCGDFTNIGHINDIIKFGNWFENLPYTYKIMIAGNHELELDPKSDNRKNQLAILRTFNFHYLENSGVEIEKIKFWGSPFTPEFFNWAFMYPRNKGEELWNNIPENTNVLITHGPPKNVLDKCVDGFKAGCDDLFKRSTELPYLKVHAFGHIHEGYGVKKINNVTYINASSATEKYKIINKPIIYEF